MADYVEGERRLGGWLASEMITVPPGLGGVKDGQEHRPDHRDLFSVIKPISTCGGTAVPGYACSIAIIANPSIAFINGTGFESAISAV